MKKYLLLLIVLIIPFTANALKIDSLGFTSNDIDNLTLYTRKDTNESYKYYINNMYAYGENDDLKVYIRAIDNPLKKDFEKNADLMDDVFGLIDRVNTNQYSFVTVKDYKWIRFQYKTKDTNIPLIEYYLAWKDLFITITIESKNADFKSGESDKINEFVRSIALDGKGKAEVSHVYLDGLDTKPKNTKLPLIIEVIICAIAIGVTYYITRKKK